MSTDEKFFFSFIVDMKNKKQQQRRRKVTFNIVEMWKRWVSFVNGWNCHF